MKNWIEIKNNRIFLCVLLLLIVINVFATISENIIILQITKPLFIPTFLMYYFTKNRYINYTFLVFLLLSFIGDFSSVLIPNYSVTKVSSLFYCLSYIWLFYIIISKFKRIEFDKVIGAYLVIVFLVNTYFLYTLFDILRAIIPDNLEIVFFGVKSVSLIALTFVALAVYLNSDTKQSIMFLTMSLCFVFSDVLYYISNYYIYDSSFVMLDRVLHCLGLFFLFNYMIDQNRKRKKHLVTQRIMSKNVLA